MSIEDLDISQTPEGDEIATKENVIQLADVWLTCFDTDSSDWEYLKKAIHEFSLHELVISESEGGPLRVKDIGPRIRAFYQGYMACHDQWSFKIDK